MPRILIKEAKNNIDQEITLAGWVHIRRDHGKLIFLDLRDESGLIQMVALPNHEEAHKLAGTLRPEWVIEVTGKVNKRPEKMVNTEEVNGEIEIEIETIFILSGAKELPFDRESEINLDTYLDYLPLNLRNKRAKAIFRIQTSIIQKFREFLVKENFTEIQVPKIIGDDAEGGANSFNLEYFGHTAHLAQSPQFYKQIMVGVFEKVFTTGNVYRAEKHSTTRHLNEYTSLDLEMGFIKDFHDITKLENRLLVYIIDYLKDHHSADFKMLSAEIPEVSKEIPMLKLREAQEIIKKEFNEDCTSEPDLEPQHERWICEYVKKTWNSDFVFISHFPLSKRPMYTHEDSGDPGYAGGFDLLFRGLEITTGGQRIHEYDKLVESIKKKGLNPESFSYYLQAFKYGMPPHGGLGMGLERLTARLLNIDNVRETTLFPRDLNRIDRLLSN